MIKCEACRAFYHLCNEFNKFNNTVALMLDSIYHMTLKLIKDHILGVKKSRFCLLLSNVMMVINGCHYVTS